MAVVHTAWSTLEEFMNRKLLMGAVVLGAIALTGVFAQPLAGQ